MNVSPALRASVDARLVSLRQFLATCPPGLAGVRVVQYQEPGVLGVVDLALASVEAQVTGSMHDGFAVDWVRRNELLYLRVFATDGPRPSWERVFAQQDMTDVRAILRDAEGGDA